MRYYDRGRGSPMGIGQAPRAGQLGKRRIPMRYYDLPGPVAPPELVGFSEPISINMASLRDFRFPGLPLLAPFKSPAALARLTTSPPHHLTASPRP